MNHKQLFGIVVLLSPLVLSLIVTLIFEPIIGIALLIPISTIALAMLGCSLIFSDR